MTIRNTTKVYGTSGWFDLAGITHDIIRGLRYKSLFVEFAKNEIKDRYRRSMLGVLWIVISYLLFVGAIAVFFGSFAKMPLTDYLLYVALGYAGYQYIIGNVSDGCEVFRSSSLWIKSTSLPYSVYVYTRITRSVFPFVLHIISAVVAMAIMGWRPNLGALYVFPALAVFLFVSPAVQMFFGFLATRWADVKHLVGAATRLMFFVTPIIWVYDEVGGMRRALATFNPLTHFLEIFRAPLLGQGLPIVSWYYVLIYSAVIWGLAIFTGAIMRRRVPFWL